MCLLNFTASITPGPHVFPQKDQSVLNLGRQTYDAAVTDKHNISPAEQSVGKSFASLLQAILDSTCHQFVDKEPFLHRTLFITSDEEAFLVEPFKFTWQILSSQAQNGGGTQ
ncbi:Uncharacterized protein Adt_35627 [Abeliophyllum distichum]|uniref:Uncharacterized protein n=1 Tax=Abeliophyllum distichum TaxID=126358 RepID=A0ABD1QF94_9LAMI